MPNAMTMIRVTLLILILTTWATIVTGQNLVPNPSFEVADTCPTNLGQMNYCHSWSSYCGSPDYYNTCSIGNWTPPTIGSIGYQVPVFGNAYAGFIPFENIVPTNYREIIGAQLTSSLSIGTKYYFSFYISCAGMQEFTLASNKIGLRFSTVPYSLADSTPINNFAHYYETTIITDTTNWVQLKGSFVADSVYKYIALGNFFDNANTDTVSFGTINYYSYYFVDNVCLSSDSLTCDQTANIKYINYSDKFKIFPNPTSDQSILQFDNTKAELCTLTLYNNCGQIVRIINNSTSDQVVIKKDNLINGLYYFVLRTSDRVIATGKLAVD